METDNSATQIEIVWFGDKTLFHIGEKPVKVWQIIVGLILLSIFVPMFKKNN